MNKLQQFAAAATLLLSAGAAQAEEITVQDGVIMNGDPAINETIAQKDNMEFIAATPLNECLAQAVLDQKQEGGDSRFYTFDTTAGGLTHKFEAGKNIGQFEDGKWVAAYVYPEKTGLGSLEIIAADMGAADAPDTDVTAHVLLDKDNVKADEQLYQNTGFKADDADQVRVNDQARTVVAAVRNCMAPAPSM